MEKPAPSAQATSSPLPQNRTRTDTGARPGTDAPPQEPPRTLSALLAELQLKVQAMETVTVGTIVEALHERGIGVILLFFAVPMALPVPVPPGLNVLLAAPLVLLTAQQALGSHTIWLPEHITEKSVGREKLVRMIDAIEPWIKRAEKVIRPRFGWLTYDGPSRFFGLLGFVMALSVLIPVPLTNSAPSLGISLMAIGVIMRDGLAVLAGAIFGTAWVSMLVLGVAFFGAEAFEIIKEAIKAFL